MKISVKLVNRLGLHTRPAKAFAKAAAASEGDVAVSFGEKTVNGKSMIALMSLGAPCGAEIDVETDENSTDLSDALLRILETHYD